MTGKVCPLYQVIFNVVRFAASRRLQKQQEAKLLKELRANMSEDQLTLAKAKRKMDRLASDIANVSDEDEEESDESEENSPITHLPKNLSVKVYRSQVFVKLL